MYNTWNTDPVQTTPIATGLTVGDYTGFVTDANGCQDSISGTVSLFIGVAGREHESTLLIYPNPTSGILHINFNNEHNEVSEIQLFNTLGKRVLRLTSITKSLLLDMSEYEAGVYFLKVSNQESVFVRKVILSN